MSMLLQVFYILPVFIMMYLLYEIIDYKRTKNFLQFIKLSIRDDLPIPTKYGIQFLIDFLTFIWTIVAIIITIFNGMWLILGLTISIILIGLIQMLITIQLSKQNKNIVLSYYITTIMIFGLFGNIILLTNAIDLLLII